MPLYSGRFSPSSFNFSGQSAANMIWHQLRPHMNLHPLLKKALEKVDRSLFVPSLYRECCYHDRDILLTSLEEEQKYLLSPSVLSKLLAQIDIAELIALKKKVLILSSRTGYSAALFGEMGIKCYTEEKNSNLSSQSIRNLEKYPNIIFCSPDLESSKNEISFNDSFDVIVIDGGSIQELPVCLSNFLSAEGYILCLFQQDIPAPEGITFCQGTKVHKDYTKTRLFQAWASSNIDFLTCKKFKL